MQKLIEIGKHCCLFLKKNQQFGGIYTENYIHTTVLDFLPFHTNCFKPHNFSLQTFFLIPISFYRIFQKEKKMLLAIQTMEKFLRMNSFGAGDRENLYSSEYKESGEGYKCSEMLFPFLNC